MEFDKSKVYTALNADESLIGAKGYFADTTVAIKALVYHDFKKDNYGSLESILDYMQLNNKCFQFFYLVEPAPDKWYVFEEGDTYETREYKTEPIPKGCENTSHLFEGTREDCEQFISGHSKPKYRPFKNCDELIENYNHNFDALFDGILAKDLQFMPTIWVKSKTRKVISMITDFEEDTIDFSYGSVDMHYLFDNFTFLDGSACGEVDDD